MHCVVEFLSSQKAFREWVKLWKLIEDCITSEDITLSFFKEVEAHEKHLSSVFSALNRDDDCVRKNCSLQTLKLF